MALASAQLAIRSVGMKIGLVSPYDLDHPGGVQNQVLELARRLASDDEVVLIGPGAGVHGGVDLGRSVRIRANRSVAPISLAPRLWFLLRSVLVGVDVVHIHEPLMPMVGWGGLRADLPSVLTFHADPPEWVEGAYRLVPRSWWRKRVLTAVSPVAAAPVSEWGEVEIIPNGIDASAYRRGYQRKRHQVAFLGRPEPRKGLAVLEAAWARVVGAIPAARLVVMSSEGESTDSKRYLGRVSEEVKLRTLAESEIFVAPNLGGESFGIVVLEAMAAGCAVVASDLEAFRYVTAGTARIFPSGDDGNLAATLIELLRNPGVTSSMGKLSRDRANDFDWSKVVSKYRSAYAGATETHPSSR